MAEMTQERTSKMKRLKRLISKAVLEVVTKVSIRLIIDVIRNILKDWTCRTSRQFFFYRLHD